MGYYRNYPWVTLDESGHSICPNDSINPGHWKWRWDSSKGRSSPGPERDPELGLCRCYDIAIFKWEDDAL